jgi:deoxycytidine triphosphate deaminase
MLTHIASNTSSSSLSLLDDESIQPNAVDLKLDRVFEMFGSFKLDEQTKKHRQKVELEPNADGYFVLTPGAYEVSFKGIVSMGGDEAGYVITRSTLNRNGVFITSGLYDSGYEGSMAACLHVAGGDFIVAAGTRLGQFILWKSEALHKYDGDYGLGKGMDAHLRS